MNRSAPLALVALLSASLGCSADTAVELGTVGVGKSDVGGLTSPVELRPDEITRLRLRANGSLTISLKQDTSAARASLQVASPNGYREDTGIEPRVSISIPGSDYEDVNIWVENLDSRRLVGELIVKSGDNGGGGDNDHAPEFDEVSDVTAGIGDTVTITVRARDLDGDTIDLRAQPSSGIWDYDFSVDSRDTGTFRWDAAERGDHSVTFVADDGEWTTRKVVEISVQSCDCNYYGCYVTGGGDCNYYGCFRPGGGCNYYGCWETGGGCNYYGCWEQGQAECDYYNGSTLCDDGVGSQPCTVD